MHEMLPIELSCHESCRYILQLCLGHHGFVSRVHVVSLFGGGGLISLAQLASVLSCICPLCLTLRDGIRFVHTSFSSNGLLLSHHSGVLNVVPIMTKRYRQATVSVSHERSLRQVRVPGMSRSQDRRRVPCENVERATGRRLEEQGPQPRCGRDRSRSPW